MVSQLHRNDLPYAGAVFHRNAGIVRESNMLTSITESTNTRVKNFAVMIMVGVVALGAWQVSQAHPLAQS